MPVADNQFVHKGDLLMEIDPAHYKIAVDQAQATVAARRADLRMRRDDATRRADLDNEVVSKESRDNATQAASGAAANLQQAQAELDAAELNLARTRVFAPVDGYVTNLNVHRGDYATAGAAKLAIVDSHSFWVYGYFEETKLPHVRIGDKAEMRLMSGGVLKGHVQSISRGIYDRDNPQSRELLADVNPTFNWVRLAQRVPVRIRIDEVPEGLILAAGTTCTVVVTPSS
jgi:RND family efflux transporter MFP subunit